MLAGSPPRPSNCRCTQIWGLGKPHHVKPVRRWLREKVHDSLCCYLRAIGVAPRHPNKHLIRSGFEQECNSHHLRISASRGPGKGKAKPTQKVSIHSFTNQARSCSLRRFPRVITQRTLDLRSVKLQIEQDGIARPVDGGPANDVAADGDPHSNVPATDDAAVAAPNKAILGTVRKQRTRVYENIVRIEPDRRTTKSIDEVLIIAKEKHLVIVGLPRRPNLDAKCDSVLPARHLLRLPNVLAFSCGRQRERVSGASRRPMKPVCCNAELGGIVRLAPEQYVRAEGDERGLSSFDQGVGEGLFNDRLTGV